MYRAKILITLRKSILDPQGKAIHHALESLGLSNIREIRMGKYLEMMIDSSTAEEARKTTQEACTKLLANPVMEDFNYTIEEIKD
jgi:phosphoribosylformylglycinamidine synthase PurS subunit